MAIVIGSNVTSLGALRQLAESTSELSSVFTRLSSGLRINKAADDAAGLAVASLLDADARVFHQGVRNLNDGISLLSIAERAVRELSGIATRLQELAEQAANGTLSDEQRGALHEEALALAGEFNRTVDTTGVSGLGLLNGPYDSVVVTHHLGANPISHGQAQIPLTVLTAASGLLGVAVAFATWGHTARRLWRATSPEREQLAWLTVAVVPELVVAPLNSPWVEFAANVLTCAALAIGILLNVHMRRFK